MKKIISGTVTFLSLIAILFSAAGCNTDDHEHSVSSWTVLKPATCTNEGLREGTCGICYQNVQEVIPVDENNHVYGEWAVSAPTMENTGLAVKTCTENSEHFITYTLPKFSDSILYTSEVIKRPTAVSKGISRYTYPHELGDIVFELEIDSTDMTVGDAVSLGSADESHEMIRSVSGARGTKKVDGSQDVSDPDLSDAFGYELYEKYTHITSDDAAQYFVSNDSQGVYGYRLDGQNNFTTLDSSYALSYIYGYGYYVVHAGDTISTTYGTEKFLASLYQYGKLNGNGDFKEWISDGVYNFSFGLVNLYGGGLGGGFFSQILVSFTLSDSYTIDWIKYYDLSYANDDSFYDMETGTWDKDAPFDFDESGHAYIKNSAGLHYVEVIEATQTERKEGETELENPYTADTRFYSDFDILYENQVIDENTEISLAAGTNSGYVFKLANFTPADVVGDEIKFYYRQYDAKGREKDTLVDWSTELSVGIVIYMDGSTNSFFIRSNIAGNLTFAVKTKNVTKTFSVNFMSIAPTVFYPTVYNYYAADGYVGLTSHNSQNSATVYVGQPLYYKASLSDAESSKCSESFVTTVEGGENYYIQDSVPLTTAANEFVSCSVFTAYTAGTYELTLTSTVDAKVKCTITVTVEERPDLEELLSGVYTATFGNSKNDVTVTFGEISSQTILGDNGTETAIKHNVTAKVNYGGVELNVNCYYYTDTKGTAILDENYMPVNEVVRILYSEMESEPPKEEWIFTIAFNEAYDITITHSLGSLYDGVQETAILKRAS